MRSQLKHNLFQLREELEQMELWQNQPPAQEKLDSTMPFCVDTLEFPEWLQWIFYPRLVALIEGGHRLPETSAITEYAEFWASETGTEANYLLEKIEIIDRLICSIED